MKAKLIFLPTKVTEMDNTCKHNWTVILESEYNTMYKG